MATYYVATAGGGGSDSNPGTIGSPFLTIAKGLSVMVSGDILYIRAGTYLEGIDSNSQTIPTGTSFANAPLIAAYPGETVTLRPSSGGEVFNFPASYIKYIIFDGLILDATGVTQGVSIGGGANHVRLRNMEVKNSNDNGIAVVPSTGNAGAPTETDFNEFINVHVHTTGLAGRGHGFYIQTSNNLIDGCESNDNQRFGIQIYNGYGQTPNNNIIRNNNVYNSGLNTSLGGGGFTINGSNTLVYNNLSWNNASGNGIDSLWNSPTNNKFYNNTIYGNVGAGMYISGSNAIIKNNIVYGNGDSIISTGSGTIMSNNLTTNPFFVNASAGNFHLTSASIDAIDKGVVIN